MKITSLATVFVFSFSAVFAETTLELIKSRAESGDATAQTLMGLMTYYGYQSPRDTKAAEEWYQRAADQGDVFAASRRDIANGVLKDFRSMSPDELKIKIEQASSAPYEGDVTFDELVLNRDKYIGKVIELSFRTIVTIGGPTGGIPYIYVRDPRADSQGGSSDKLYLCGENAMKWKFEVGKKYYGTVSTICALVEKDGLIALGIRQRQTETGREYKWQLMRPTSQVALQVPWMNRR